MQKADLGIQSHRFQGGAHVVDQQGVEEGEQGVDGIQGRALVPSLEMEILLLGGDEFGEHPKIEVGALPFVAPRFLQVGGGLDVPQTPAQGIDGL